MLARIYKKWVCAGVWIICICTFASVITRYKDGNSTRVIRRDWYTKPNLFFDSRFKNPCWFESNTTDRLSCLPYFYVPGFGKSGTTSLCGSLSLHPDIVSPRDKELGFWDVNDIRKAIPYYVRLLDSATNDIYKAKTTRSKNYSNKITYDCTPRYVWSRPTSLPRELYDLNPSSRIIFIMRHPTDKLYSLYHHETLRVGRQFSPDHFAQDVRVAIATFKSCIKARTLLKCVLLLDKKTVTMNYLLYSLYTVYAKLWLDVFPRQQMLFLKAEDYYNDVPGTMSEICKFLNISEMSTGVLRQIKQFQKSYTPEGLDVYVRRYVHADISRLNTSMVNVAQNQWYGYRDTLSAGTRQALDTFYEPYNRELASLLNDRRFLFER